MSSAYSFLPWLRRGIATQISQDPGTAARASIEVKLRIDGTPRAAGTTLTREVGHDVQLYGPGDVIGVDPRSIVRTEPRDWVTNFDPNYLAFVEFYEEDYCWRYSPAVPDATTGRLAPWLALIVLTVSTSGILFAALLTSDDTGQRFMSASGWGTSSCRRRASSLSGLSHVSSSSGRSSTGIRVCTSSIR